MPTTPYDSSQDSQGAARSEQTSAVCPDAGNAGAAPLLDPTVLEELEQELEDVGTVRAFVSDYVAFWDERIHRLSSSLAEEDAKAALEAVVNLRAASTMVGAPRLSARASRIEGFLRRFQLREALGALPALERCGRDTVVELRTTYLLTSDCL
ncbi:Hpt domain-containing protein [Arthrobacter sp. MSA 4-2]|uniref:Hpt domain-containing protein n=1 Tax=Arthrobacter sp. MSA 4-2 TaxID=2794349 RepID=UPI0018E7041C|nr:Hpt domain-containing protein [Arthrobacter sp. MSA 4-2]MBJ2120502.1 Hpt domain-containing protein [Arthrobacter sp. MSA 4-2]